MEDLRLVEKTFFDNLRNVQEQVQRQLIIEGNSPVNNSEDNNTQPQQP